MGPPAAAFWTCFALGASMRGHPGAKISKTYQHDAANASKVSARGFKAPKINLKVCNGSLSFKIVVYIWIYVCIFLVTQLLF